jgi:hypothetical protein
LERQNVVVLTELVVVSSVSVRVRSIRLLLEEISVRDGRESRCLVDDRSLVDLLVDNVGVVDGGRLDGLALDHGLN